MNPPSEAEPVELGGVPCPACGGDPGVAPACHSCRGRGCELLTGCPKLAVGADVAGFIEYAEFAESGAWPAGPSVLDNTQVFCDAMRCFRSAEAVARARAKAPPK